MNRIEREKSTLAGMIEIYCRRHHQTVQGREPLCEEAHGFSTMPSVALTVVRMAYQNQVAVNAEYIAMHLIKGMKYVPLCAMWARE